MRYRISTHNNIPNGRTLVTDLFSTDDISHFNRVKSKVEAVIGNTPPGRVARRVYIVSHDIERLNNFRHTMPRHWWPKLIRILKSVDHFSSLNGLAQALFANPATLRVALSKATRAGKEFATVRGVSFRYGSHDSDN